MSPPPSAPFSHELLLRILTHLPRKRDLLTLLRVSKTFNTLSLPLLYTNPILPNTPHTHIFFYTLLSYPERQAYIKALTIQPGRGVHWDLVREGLSGMRNLESLLLVYTGEGTGGWVLDPPSEDGWCFCLKELRIRMGYDVALLSFLQNQPTLRTLHIHPIECPPLLQPLPPAIHLPLLTTYDGTLSLLPLLLSHIVPPLTGIQLLIDINSTKDTTSLDTALSALRALSKVGKTLRGLSMHDIPDDWVAPFLSVVSKTCPYLRHLGVIPVSKETNLAQIQTPLFPLRNLTTLEMDLSLLFTPSSSSSHYSPSPTYTQHAPQLLTPVLRTIVAEMKTMRPSLVVLGVWVYGTRWRWMFKGHGGVGTGGIVTGESRGSGEGRGGSAAGNTNKGEEEEEEEYDENSPSPSAGLNMEWKHFMEHTRAQSGAQVGWNGWWSNVM